MNANLTHRVTLDKDYINLEFWGKLDVTSIRDAADKTVALHNQHKISKLLCDVSLVNYDEINVPLQVEGMTMVWKIKDFHHVAFLIGNEDFGKLVESTLEQLHLSSKFRCFPDKNAALKWLDVDKT